MRALIPRGFFFLRGGASPVCFELVEDFLNSLLEAHYCFLDFRILLFFIHEKIAFQTRTGVVSPMTLSVFFFLHRYPRLTGRTLRSGAIQKTRKQPLSFNTSSRSEGSKSPAPGIYGVFTL